MVGLTYGERIYSLTGSCFVKDIVNKVEIEIKYNPDKEQISYMQSFKKMWGSRPANVIRPSDTLDATIYRIEQDETRTKLGKGSGSWLSHLEFEGVCYWKIDQKFTTWSIVQDEIILPSDSSNRADLIHLRER